MKRHFWFIFFLILELVYSVALFFSYDTLWLLFLANLAVFLLLMLEPYWKIGGWLVYFMSAEVFIYFLNKKTYALFLHSHSIVNVLVIFFGFILVMAAYYLKQQEGKMPREEPVPEENKKAEDETIEEPAKKLAAPSKTLLASGNTVHLKDCSVAKKAKETRIVNERYAKAQKMKECKRCKPYSSTPSSQVQ